jgi:Spy/CpxP family protein refolding chaperone
MRRFLGISSLAIVACLVASNAAMAQGQGRGGRGGRGGFGGGFGGISFLIQNADVQKDLKLSEDQTAKIKEVTDALRPQRGGGGGTNFRDMTEEQRTAFFEEARKKGEEANKKITDLLTADQNVRLKQLQIWQQGTRALTNNEDVAKELSITDDQKSALKTITDESAKKGQELGRGLGRGASEEERTKAREQMTALRSETEAECMAVLTDDQKAKLTAMKGTKPDFNLNAFGGGGGRRGGRGRPGGNNN